MELPQAQNLHIFSFKLKGFLSIFFLNWMLPCHQFSLFWLVSCNEVELAYKIWCDFFNDAFYIQIVISVLQIKGSCQVMFLQNQNYLKFDKFTMISTYKYNSDISSANKRIAAKWCSCRIRVVYLKSYKVEMTGSCIDSIECVWLLHSCLGLFIFL